jgi:hypothetical protein
MPIFWGRDDMIEAVKMFLLTEEVGYYLQKQTLSFWGRTWSQVNWIAELLEDWLKRRITGVNKTFVGGVKHLSEA